MVEKKRLFIAIPFQPNEPMLDELAKIRQMLSFDSINWIAPNQFHLTLKFIGETPVSKMESIENAMKKAFLHAKPFDISLESVKIFGSEYKPRVIWTRFCPEEITKALFKKLKTEMEAIGFDYDRQNFVPHITLGRIRNIRDRKLLKSVTEKYDGFEFTKSVASEVVLYESILKADGPEYVDCFAMNFS